MSENLVTLNELTQEDVNKFLETLKKLVKIGDVLADITPNTFDDTVVAKVKSAIEVVEPVVQNPAVIDIINYVIRLIKKDDPAVVLAKLQNLA